MTMLKTPPGPDDHSRGDPNAPVVMVEYGDYQCPYCAAAEPNVEALMDNFSADLRLVFRHFPLTQAHPMAEAAAESAEFAGAHGAFWPMHEALFANQPQISLPVILATAGRLNLSESALLRALEAGTYAAKVRKDFIGGVRSGVNGTPCFFINGVRHDRGYGFDELAEAVLAARAAAPDTTQLSSPHAGP